MKKLLILAVAASPFLSFAQELESLVGRVQNIINTLLGVMVSLAILAFFYGLAKYIFNQADEKKKTEGKGIMLWGIVALFVMVSIWGIVNFLQETLGVDETENVNEIVVPGVDPNS